jgi:cytochrome d ubiquinol oxidase subunit I
MLRMGLGLASLILPIQLFMNHLNGDYVHDLLATKIAPIEARWRDAGEY